jgi:anti-sigma regulatory factor (Ser/Thr protein kinase)
VSGSGSERIDLLADASSVGEARSFVRRVLISWDLEEPLDVVSLLVSELATNAVLHARTAYAVVLSHSVDSIRVEVLDDSSSSPRQRHQSASATTGRGVALVAHLASTWGTRQDQAGFAKGVWFTVPLSGVEDNAWNETL